MGAKSESTSSHWNHIRDLSCRDTLINLSFSIKYSDSQVNINGSRRHYWHMSTRKVELKHTLFLLKKFILLLASSKGQKSQNRI